MSATRPARPCRLSLKRRWLAARLLLADRVALTAADIVAIAGDLGARIVTLGACEGGATAMAAGDEPMGLATALLLGGVDAVRAPLWPFDAEDAAAMMDAFYGHLLERPDLCLASCLQAAVRTLRAKPDTAMPYSWAPWVLHGDWGAGETYPGCRMHSSSAHRVCDDWSRLGAPSSHGK